jgi:hypothetical protein
MISKLHSKFWGRNTSEFKYLKKNNNCEQKFRSLISFIKDKNSDVIVISRWSFGLYPIKGYIEDMPYKNNWDAQGLPDGVYYYQFRRDQNSKVEKGSIIVKN